MRSLKDSYRAKQSEFITSFSSMEYNKEIGIDEEKFRFLITKDKVCKIKDSSNSGKYVFFDLYPRFYDEEFYNKDDKKPNPSQINKIKSEIRKVRRNNNNYE